MLRSFLSILIICLFTSFSYSQLEKRSLLGSVIDATTKEPLPFVNVFFANTSIGASSLTDGSFQIKNIAPGKYDLVASYIGYKPYSIPIDFSDQSSGFTSEIKIIIELEQEAKELSEIIVKADTANRARNYKDFLRNFIGETHNAKKCKILNPKDIHLYFDPKENTLVAHSKKPIEIENRALGYKISYYLYQFEVNFRTGTLYIFGVPRYEELTPEGDRQARVWERERVQAYLGSVNHFMRALRDSAIIENGFEVKKVFTIPNINRPSDEFLTRKIRELSKKNKDGMIVFSNNAKDSLSYYTRLRSQPKERDSIAEKKLTGSEFKRSSPDRIENIKGKYQIVHREKEEVEYLPYMGRKYTEKQKSLFNFLNQALTIYANGYYEDVKTLFLEGYLSWHEKMSNLLPLEYHPMKKQSK